MDNIVIQEWGKGVYDLLSWFEADRVKNAKVLVAGAGALGNEIIKNLALFGIGNLFIIDFDTIEYTNLTRSILFRESDADKGLFKAEVAAARVREINPNINVHSIVGRLGCDVGLGLYRRMDVAIGGLDSLLARIELNRQCIRANIPWVDGGIENLNGQASVYRRGVCCYECELPATTKEAIAHRISCADIAQRNIAHQRIPTTPVIASIIGAIEVQEAMKIIHEDSELKNNFTSLTGKCLDYNGNIPRFRIIQTESWNRNCPSHEFWEPVVKIIDLSADDTIEKALTILGQTLGCTDVEINLRNDQFVDFLVVRGSEHKYSPMLPKSRIPDYIDSIDNLRNRSWENINQHVIENIGRDFPYQQLTLHEVGIPYLDILQVSTEKGYAYVELSHDTNRFNIQ